MGKTWSDESTRMGVGLVKAQICAMENFGISFHEMYQFISKPEKVACTATLSNMKTVHLLKI
jgi:hypothetical protein